MDKEKLILKVKIDDNKKKRIDIYLKEHTEFSRTKIQELIDSGNVFLNRKIVNMYHKKVKNGDEIELIIEKNLPDDYELIPADIPLNIIYEDEYLFVINKQQGLVVHPAKGHYDDTLVNAIISKIDMDSFIEKERIGIVHRLDKDTSGAMVIAKNEEAREKLSLMFKQRQINKVYLALVHGQIEREGYINTYIRRDIKDRKKFTAKFLAGKDAQTIFYPEEIFSLATFLKVKILTGRTHQIRVHMSYIKHEIIGDSLYGNKTKDINLLEFLGFSSKSYREIMPRQMLHSHILEFVHPFKNEKMRFKADIPEDFNRLLKLLRERQK